MLGPTIGRVWLAWQPAIVGLCWRCCLTWPENLRCTFWRGYRSRVGRATLAPQPRKVVWRLWQCPFRLRYVSRGFVLLTL